MIPLGILASSYVAPAGLSLSLAYIGTVAGGAGGASVTATFTDVPFGPEDPTRTLVIAVAHRGTQGYAAASATIAGVDAIKDVAWPTLSQHISIWRAEVPTGTTGTVTYTVSGGAFTFWCGLGVWAITGTAVSVADSAYYSYYPGDVPVDVSTGDVVISAVSMDSNPGVAWSNVTERYEGVISGVSASRIMSGADAVATTAGTLAVSAGYGGATSHQAAVAAVAYTAA